MLTPAMRAMRSPCQMKILDYKRMLRLAQRRPTLVPARRRQPKYPCRRALPSTLPLFVTRVFTYHAHHPVASDDLAMTTNLLNRCLHSHFQLRCRFSGMLRRPRLFRSEYNARPAQIIGRQLNRDLVARQDADVVHAHLAGDMTQYYVAVFQFYSKSSIWQGFNDLPLHLYGLFLRHAQRVGNIPPLKLAFLSKLSYWCDMT